MVAALAVAQPAAASDRTLERYAEGTWRSFEAMTDAQQRAAERHPRERRHAQRADLDHQHRRLHVERRGGREAGHHPPLRAGGAHAAHRGHARGHGAARAERPVLQLVRPPDGREADDLAAVGRAADADPLVGRQRLARRRPEDRRRADPRAVAAGRRALRRDGLRLLLPAGRQPDAVPLRAGHRRGGRAATTRSSARAGSPPTSAIAKGEVPERVHFGQCRSFPRLVRLELDRDAPGRLHPHLLRHLGLRRLAALQRHAGHAELGRQHVRGADAGAVPARGALGPGELGRQPPAHRRRPDPPRAGRGRLRLLGLLAVQHPGGRLHRATASTASAATRAATRRTTTAR